jgi:hypothetical protein
MAQLTLDDLGFFKCSTPAITLTTTNVGGEVSANPINGSVIGEVHFAVTPNALGGAPVVQYNKFFLVNSSLVNDAVSIVAWIENGLIPMTANSQITAVSDSSLDGATIKLRYIGFDVAGNPQLVEIQLNGTTPVTTSSYLFMLDRVEVRLVASPFSLTPLAGNVTIIAAGNSLVLGVMPTGVKGATREIAIGIEAVQNGNTTTVNATTPPVGITMSSPNTYGGGLAFASGGTLAAGSGSVFNGQGIWSSLSVSAASKPSEDAVASINCRVNLAA